MNGIGEEKYSEGQTERMRRELSMYGEKKKEEMKRECEGKQRCEK